MERRKLSYLRLFLVTLLLKFSCAEEVYRCSLSDEKCIFPFEYDGNTYETCTTAGTFSGSYWCYTDGDYGWAYCKVCEKDKTTSTTTTSATTTTTMMASSPTTVQTTESTTSTSTESTTSTVKPTSTSSLTTSPSTTAVAAKTTAQPAAPSARTSSATTPKSTTTASSTTKSTTQPTTFSSTTTKGMTSPVISSTSSMATASFTTSSTTANHFDSIISTKYTTTSIIITPGVKISENGEMKNFSSSSTSATTLVVNASRFLAIPDNPLDGDFPLPTHTYEEQKVPRTLENEMMAALQDVESELEDDVSTESPDVDFTESETEPSTTKSTTSTRPPTTTTLPPSAGPTKSCTRSGKMCQFPFEYEGVTYTSCVSSFLYKWGWCYVDVSIEDYSPCVPCDSTTSSTTQTKSTTKPAQPKTPRLRNPVATTKLPTTTTKTSRTTSVTSTSEKSTELPKVALTITDEPSDLDLPESDESSSSVTSIVLVLCCGAVLIILAMVVLFVRRLRNSKQNEVEKNGNVGESGEGLLAKNGNGGEKIATVNDGNSQELKPLNSKMDEEIGPGGDCHIVNERDLGAGDGQTANVSV